jgi:hypothetical protein
MAEYQMQRIVGAGEQSITLDGDWWMGNGLGQFVHSQQRFSGWNWGDTWIGRILNVGFTVASGTGGAVSAYQFVQQGIAGASGGTLGWSAFGAVGGLGGASYTTYTAATYRSDYQIMLCTNLASFC